MVSRACVPKLGVTSRAQLANALPGDTAPSRHTVTAIHVTDDDKDFVNLTIGTGTGPKVIQTTGEDDIFMVSRGGMTIRFSENDVRPMGRATAGVRGMKLKNDEDSVVGAAVARDGAVMLFVSSSGHGKRTKLDAFNRQGRGGQGVRGMKITASRGSVVAAFTVAPTDEILVFSSAGNIIRMEAKEISAQGRDATGVRVRSLPMRRGRMRRRKTRSLPTCESSSMTPPSTRERASCANRGGAGGTAAFSVVRMR